MKSITLITGAPGSGKSTISKLVAKRLPRCLLISVDDLREMMVTGLATPDQGITDEGIRQFQMARSVAIHMAGVYAAQGVHVIIDDVCVPHMFADHYAPMLNNGGGRGVMLMPDRTTMVERIRQRGGPWDAVLINGIPEIYDYLEPLPKDGWIVLDTGDWTVEHTVQVVIERLGLELDEPAHPVDPGIPDDGQLEA
ncbi:MAG: AAA family ATPase [Opitutaceae bacterium]